MVFFEGSEKKLEIVMRAGTPSLRLRGKEFWQSIVAKSRASILSQIKNDSMDAYLLSESSLFVSDDRVLMITCGTTTLVHAAIALLQTFDDQQVELLIYERKREIFPEYQRSNFYQDVKLLKEQLAGTALRFGDEDDHHIYLFYSANNFTAQKEDRTLEILMHGLDRQAAQIFESGNAHNEQSILKSGVRDLLPGYLVDDFIFEPQGYSLNAIRDKNYFTIHVTPQAFGSYVSFETNHPVAEDLAALVERVLEVFRPNSFDLFYFEKTGAHTLIPCSYEKKQSYKTTLAGFDVSFDHYFRASSQQKLPETLEID